MKQKIIYLLYLSTFFIACSSDKSTTDRPINQQYTVGVNLPVDSTVLKEAKSFFIEFANWYDKQDKLEKTSKGYSTLLTNIETTDLLSDQTKMKIIEYYKTNPDDTTYFLPSLLYDKPDYINDIYEEEDAVFQCKNDKLVDIVTSGTLGGEEGGPLVKIILTIEKKNGNWQLVSIVNTNEMVFQ